MTKSLVIRKEQRSEEREVVRRVTPLHARHPRGWIRPPTASINVCLLEILVAACNLLMHYVHIEDRGCISSQGIGRVGVGTSWFRLGLAAVWSRDLVSCLNTSFLISISTRVTPIYDGSWRRQDCAHLLHTLCAGSGPLIGILA